MKRLIHTSAVRRVTVAGLLVFAAQGGRRNLMSTRRRWTLILTVVLTLGIGTGLGADYYNDNPWFESEADGYNDIWVSWSLDDATACAGMSVSSGRARIETWVHGGWSGTAIDEDDGGAFDCAEDDNGPFCGQAAGKANFWNIIGSTWEDYGQHESVGVYTESCEEG